MCIGTPTLVPDSVGQRFSNWEARTILRGGANGNRKPSCWTILRVGANVNDYS